MKGRIEVNPDERIIKAYPGITKEDVVAALSYAEQHMRYEEVHSLELIGVLSPA